MIPLLALVLAGQWASTSSSSQIGSWGASKRATSAVSFRWIAGTTTPNDLTDALVVNGASATLMNSCKASSLGLVCTSPLAEAGAGTSPTTTIKTAAHAFDATERGVTFGVGQKRLDASTVSVFDVTSDDLIVEAVLQSPASGAIILDKSLASTAGWSLGLNSTTAIRLSLRTGSVTSTVDGPSNNPSEGRAHYLCFIDRSENSTNGSACFADGVQGTGVNMSARSASATNTVAASVGAISGGVSTGSTIIGLRAWTCPASTCLTGGAGNLTAISAIARDRSAMAAGVGPTFAAGSRVPTVMTRSSIAEVDVDDPADPGVRVFYAMSNAGMRVARRHEERGTDYVSLFTPENTSTNIWDFSDDATDVSWTKAQCVATDGESTPFSGGSDTSGDALESLDAAGSVEHYVEQVQTVTASTFWTQSCFVKIGSDSATHIWLRDSTIANGVSWFLGSTCAKTSAQAGVVLARGESLGNGWCRVASTVLGTAAAHTFDVGYSNADGVTAFNDGTDTVVDAIVVRCQLEAMAVATSPIKTATAANVARSADSLSFAGGLNVAVAGEVQTIKTKQMLQSPIEYANAPIRTFAATEQAANVVRSNVQGYPNVVVGNATMFSGGVQNTNTVGIHYFPTGDITEQTVAVNTNNVKVSYNGFVEATDTSATLPAIAATSISVGGLTGVQQVVAGGLAQLEVFRAYDTGSISAGHRLVALGDSLTAFSIYGVPWDILIEGAGSAGTVAYTNDIAVGGKTSTQIRDEQWTAQAKGAGYSTLFIMGGTNDLSAGVLTAAQIYDPLHTIYSEAKAEGMTTVCLLILPRNASGATQVKLTDINALISADASCDFVVDSYSAVLGVGTALLAAYDFGDGLHLNQVGHKALADAVLATIGHNF